MTHHAEPTPPCPALSRLSVGAMACVAVCALPRVASAAELPCAGIFLHVDDSVDAPWLDALGSVCRQLGTGADIDSTARVFVGKRGERLVIDVRLGDGRSAEREVERAGDIRTTLEALLALPPKKATAPMPTKEPATNPEPPAAQRPTATPGAPVHLDVGGGLSTRIAGSVPYGSVGPSGFAAFRSGRWLLDLSMRWEALEAPFNSQAAPLEMQTIAATFSVDRRVIEHGLTLDIGVGPSWVLESQGADVAGDERAGSETDLRVATHARMAVGEGPLKWALGLDAEVAPARLRRTRRIDEMLPPLPAWSAGVLMGVVWSDQ